MSFFKKDWRKQNAFSPWFWNINKIFFFERKKNLDLRYAPIQDQRKPLTSANVYCEIYLWNLLITYQRKKERKNVTGCLLKIDHKVCY